MAHHTPGIGGILKDIGSSVLREESTHVTYRGGSLDGQTLPAQYAARTMRAPLGDGSEDVYTYAATRIETERIVSCYALKHTLIPRATPLPEGASPRNTPWLYAIVEPQNND